MKIHMPIRYRNPPIATEEVKCYFLNGVISVGSDSLYSFILHLMSIFKIGRYRVLIEHALLSIIKIYPSFDIKTVLIWKN